MSVVAINPQRDPHTPSPAGPRTIRLDVPCAQCGYNIKGLQSDGKCPECATSIEQSLAFIVDLSRERIPAVAHPTRIGMTLVGLVGLILLATIVLWLPHVLMFVDNLTGQGGILWFTFPHWNAAVAAGFALLAAILTHQLRRPTGGPAPPEYERGLTLARSGLVLWAAMLIILAWYDTSFHPRWEPVFSPDDPLLGRSIIRLVSEIVLILPLVGFRPVVAFLGLRSLNHRIGRISRQGFHAILVALLMVALGDACLVVLAALRDFAILPSSLSPVGYVGVFLVLVGSALLSLALLNSFSDAIRLSHGMRRRTYLIEEILD